MLVLPYTQHQRWIAASAPAMSTGAAVLPGSPQITKVIQRDPHAFAGGQLKSAIDGLDTLSSEDISRLTPQSVQML